MKRGLIVLGILLAAGGAALFVWRGLRDGRSGPAGTIRVSGNIEAVEVQLAFRLPGWVESRAVDEGQPVRAGQVIARLDGTELGQEAKLRRADAAAAGAFLAQLEAGSRPEEIAAAEAAAARSRAEAVAAKADRARAEELRGGKVITEQEFETRKAAGDAAEAAAAQAEAQLKLVRAGARQEEIAQARARAESARQAAELAGTRLGYAELRSPLSGIVLSKVVEPGEYVSAGTPVVTVADLGTVHLRAYVNETDLGRVKLGARVAVTTDDPSGRVHEGRVVFIASQAEFTPRNIQTHKERVKLVYRVKIEIANPAGELKPGMPADADIAVD